MIFFAYTEIWSLSNENWVFYAIVRRETPILKFVGAGRHFTFHFATVGLRAPCDRAVEGHQRSCCLIGWNTINILIFYIKLCKKPSSASVGRSYNRSPFKAFFEILIMAESKRIDIFFYAGLVVRYRWYVIVPVGFAMMVGIYLGFTIPEIYMSETLILVEPQKVPENYVKSVVSTDINARISTISQQIMSRSNLEKIISEFNLFSGDDDKNIFIEKKIEAMRKRVAVRVTNAKKGSDAFTISFKGPDPVKVMKVSNALASYFINENLKVREEQAIGTSKFLDNERDEMKAKLEAVEENLKRYREMFMGELPEQLESNLRILDRLQAELTGKRETLREAKAQLLLLENQISDSFKVPLLEKPIEGVIGKTEKEPNPRQVLEEQLRALQAKYTDKHPDIIRLKKMIGGLEDLPKAPVQPVVTNEGQALMDRKSAQNQQRVKLQRLALEKQIPDLEKKIREIETEIAAYQQRVERTPKREQELMGLKRDYNNIQSAYSSLLNRKLEAEIAVNMEKRQKGEQFRIIDFARVAQLPVSPNIKRLFIMSLAAGLGLGAGLIYLRMFFDSSFQSAEDLEKETGIQVLAFIPEVPSPQAVWRRKLNIGLSALAVCYCMLLMGFFGIMAVKGVKPILEIGRRFL